MQLRHHPEYGEYRHHRQQAGRYRQALGSQPLPPASRAAAEDLLAGLTTLLQAYNRLLWQHFPYCGQCLGGCCVVGATDLKPLDYVALALLDEALPERPAQTGLDRRACIYLTPQGCSWPARWRPLKCALFYCLGSGAVAVDASDARYGEITEALAQAIRPQLEALLPEAAGALLAQLSDPVAFAGALAAALEARLRQLLPADRSLFPHPEVTALPPDDPPLTLLAFVAAATEQLWADPPAPPRDGQPTVEQFLADLETLEWLVQGRPAGALTLLAEIGSRYPAGAGGASPSLWAEMGRQIAAFARYLDGPEAA